MFERLDISINLSVTTKKLKEQTREKCDKIKADIECLQTMGELADRYIICYRNTLDTANAISTVNAAVEQEQRLKAEKEQSAEATAAQQEAGAKVDAAIVGTELAVEITPAVEVAASTEPASEAVAIYTVDFCVRGTKEQLRELKKYIIESGLEVVEK